MKPPNHCKHVLNITHNMRPTQEVDGPGDDTNVSWLLVTTLPINTVDALLQVINDYVARRTIEVWFRMRKLRTRPGGAQPAWLGLLGYTTHPANVQTHHRKKLCINNSTAFQRVPPARRPELNEAMPPIQERRVTSLSEQTANTSGANNQRVIVVGGGLAGLAATTALASRGVAVTLLEARQRPGGRASSFEDPSTGEWLDNCQHVSLGCCTNFRHFCETIGVAEHLQRQSELYFVGPPASHSDSGSAQTPAKISVLKSSWLPAPLHLLPAFRKFDYLSFREMRAISRGLRALSRWRPGDGADGQSFADWLRAQQQPPAVIDRFWHVVIVSALSETLDRVDVNAARKVFVDGFLANRNGWFVDIPGVPLSDFYGEPLQHWLANHAVDVRLSAAVRKLVVEAGQVTGVELSDGELITGAEFVLAIPWYRMPTLLPEQNESAEGTASVKQSTVAWQKFQQQCEQLSQLESAPISSLHIEFDRPITPLPHVVFVDRLSQWLFARHDSASATHRYQVVISASRDLAGRSSADVQAEIVAELAAVFPETENAKVLHARLVTERRAVFSVTPGSDALRPSQQTALANVQFAGDWTQTGWPATMEGAVRSGYLAAQNILQNRDVPVSILQPDLPIARLSRWLLGIGR